MNVAEINVRTGHVVDAAMKVHSALGPGLLERADEACLTCELRKRGRHVATQSPLPVIYDDVRIDVGYRADLLVDQVVMVELKAVAKLEGRNQAIGPRAVSGATVLPPRPRRPYSRSNG